MEFDARSAKQLVAGQHLMVGGCPGLRLQASDTKKSWTYRYRSPVDDKMRQVLIGHWPAMSLASAVVAWEALRDARQAGADPAQDKRAARKVAKPKAQQGYTVRMLCDDYLSGHVDRHRSPKSAKEMHRLLGKKYLESIEGLQAASLTRADAFKLLEGLANIPVSAQTLRGELGAAWDYALDAGRIPESSPNWWRLVMRGRLRSKGRSREGKKIGVSKRVLSESEIGQLLRWLPNFSTLVADVLQLYLWTGTRGSEIITMHATEMTEEPDGWWWTIPKAKTKNARYELATDMRVPLVGRSLAIVRRRMELSGEWLFPAKTKSGHSIQTVIGSQVYNHMPYSNVHPDRETPSLPVIHWSPHDLRRTTRTLLASMGCPDAVAEAILGHMLPGVMGTYNRHGYDVERRHWLTLLDAHLERLSQTL